MSWKREKDFLGRLVEVGEMRDVLQLQKSGRFEGVVDCKEILTDDDRASRGMESDYLNLVGMTGIPLV
jgi:hypothetical protein